MASDEDDDIEALRLAALATLKKKPALIEEAQPIPQLTTSGHSIHNSISNSSWTEDFPYNDVIVPFESQPEAPFPDSDWSLSAQALQPAVLPVPLPLQSGIHDYGQNTTRFMPNNWHGRGLQAGGFQRPFGRGRGVFPHNQRGRFGQNMRPMFGSRMHFVRNSLRPAGFSQPDRMPFSANQRPPFSTAPSVFSPGGVAGGVSGGGNLIFISTVPENGSVQPLPITTLRAPVQQMPRGVGRGGKALAGGDGEILSSADPSSKLFLSRPQDKYCPSANPVVKASEQEPERRKKKDKFSRYDSSGSESDDESEDSDDEKHSHRSFLKEDQQENQLNHTTNSEQESFVNTEEIDSDIPVADISIPVMSTSSIDFDKHEGAEMSEEPVTSDTVKLKTDWPGGDDIGEEEEERLLADSSSSSGDDLKEKEVDITAEDLKLNSVCSMDTDISPVNAVSPVQAITPVRNEESVGCGQERGENSSKESNSEDGSGDESDTSTCSSSSSSGSSSTSGSSDSSNASSSNSDDASSESSNEEKNNIGEDDDNEDENMDREGIPVQTSPNLNQNPSESESESDKETESVRHLTPVEHKVSVESQRKSASPKKLAPILTAEEKAKLEARKRKFESGQEVQVSSSKRTISLKGIVPRTKKPRHEPKRISQAVEEFSTPLASLSSKAADQAVLKKSPLRSRRPSGSDSHRKYQRRKVSIEVQKQAVSKSEADMESDSDEDEDGGSRAWMREANTVPARRKPLFNADNALPDTDRSYRGKSLRGSSFSKNGDYNRRTDLNRQRDHRGASRHIRKEPRVRDLPPDAHYSSDDDRGSAEHSKMISVVVHRSSAPHSSSTQAIESQERQKKRAIVSGRISEPKRHSRAHDKTGNISVVVSGETSSHSVPQSGSSRVPVHQRLGGKKSKKSARRSKTSATKPQSQGHKGETIEKVPSELDLRLQNIKRKNAAIMRRHEEVRRDRELFG